MTDTIDPSDPRSVFTADADSDPFADLRAPIASSAATAAPADNDPFADLRAPIKASSEDKKEKSSASKNDASKPSALKDIATGYSTGIASGINNLTKLPTETASLLTGVGAQIDNKLTNLGRYFTNTAPLSPQEQDANIAAARAPIDALTAKIPALNKLTGIGDFGATTAALAMNRMMGGNNLTPKDIADTPNPGMQNAQTPVGKIVQTGAEAIPSGLAFGQSAPISLAATAGGNIADSDNPIGQLLGGALAAGAAVKGIGSLNKVPEQPPITSEDIKNASQEQYAKADESGAILQPSGVNKAIANIEKIPPQTPLAQALAGKENSVTKAINTLKTFQDQPLSIESIMEADKQLGAMITKEITPSGSPTSEGVDLMKIRNSFRDAAMGASPEDVGGGAQGFQHWKDAMGLWSSQMKLSDIENIKDKAQYKDNPVTYMKNQFANLATNGKRLNGYTDAEIAQIKNAAKTGAGTDLLRIIGSRLNPIIAGSVGGFPGAAGGYIASEGARSIANNMQTSRINAVENAIRNRPIVQKYLPNTSKAHQAYKNNLLNSFGIPAALAGSNPLTDSTQP